MTKHTVYGVKVLACDKGCAQSYREDRRAGLIYPVVQLTRLDRSHVLVTWAEASILKQRCVYCNSGYKGDDNAS